MREVVMGELRQFQVFTTEGGKTKVVVDGRDVPAVQHMAITKRAGEPAYVELQLAPGVIATALDEAYVKLLPPGVDDFERCLTNILDYCSRNACVDGDVIRRMVVGTLNGVGPEGLRRVGDPE